VTVGGEAPVTPVSSPDSSSLDLSYKPCDNRTNFRHKKRSLNPLIILEVELMNDMVDRGTTRAIIVNALFIFLRIPCGNNVMSHDLLGSSQIMLP